MNLRDLPDLETLRELLRYEPDTGKLFWRERGPKWFTNDGYRTAKGCAKNWNSRWAGKEAFTSVNNHGHKEGRIIKEGYLAHRIIYTMYHGSEPKFIDHENGDPADNRIENLRSVTQQENSRNMKMRCDNKSGAVGVYWIAKLKKWRVIIRHEGKPKHLGMFKHKRMAVAARKQAEREYGYHQNHGRNI